jgi:hypothetical protein
MSDRRLQAVPHDVDEALFLLVGIGERRSATRSSCG